MYIYMYIYVHIYVLLQPEDQQMSEEAADLRYRGGKVRGRAGVG